MKFVASVSWGKDSLAMLIVLIENSMPLDEVVFYDTGVEFPCVYAMRDKFIKEWLEPRKIKYTEIKPKQSFLDLMLLHPYQSRAGQKKFGYGWCGGMCRWGTTEKISSIRKHTLDSYQYVGIAFDEVKRYPKDPKVLVPLVDKGITEAQALNISKSKGYDYQGFYEIFDRLSCWCCRNKNLKELKAMKKYLPEYFERLQRLEILIGEPMKKPLYLNQRFSEFVQGDLLPIVNGVLKPDFSK